jgi:hypothetical protein
MMATPPPPPILSVLIPTVEARTSSLSRLLWGLTNQTGNFEVLVHRGDDIPVGTKRNRLFMEAAGQYSVCVDDDDWLDGSYMDQVLWFLNNHQPDWLGYRILVLQEGRFWLDVEHIPGVDNWDGTTRGLTPKCPIRTTICRQVLFGDGYSADHEWALAMMPLVQGGGFIDRPLYTYDFSPTRMLWEEGRPKRKHKWNNQADLGQWPYRFDRIRWLD